MITCRVCQSLINVEGKMHQHVVKCGVCNEATVSYTHPQSRPGFLDPVSDLLILDPG
jgi:phosphatidylinositol-4,5-bisphosphate 4-phosphatase